MAYFGDTMAHSALLGVALSLFFSLNLMLSVFVVAALVSLILIVLQKRQGSPPMRCWASSAMPRSPSAL